MGEDRASEDVEIVVPLLVEDVAIGKRLISRGGIRVHVRTAARELQIDEVLDSSRVEIDRVPMNRIVESVPPIREEAGVTIISVVEEIVVVERRLMLKEEIRINRILTSEGHQESVVLREQEASIERIEPDAIVQQSASTFRIPMNQGEIPMSNQTIVAVYDTPAHAAIAVEDLEEMGVPSSAISQHAGNDAEIPAKEQGFWSSLFGAEPESVHDVHVYDRSMASGATVVTVQAPEHQVVEIANILESHGPVDIDERASTYGMARSSAGTIDPVATIPVYRTGSADEEVIQLSEESLAVGKRAVNRGTTRVRRYVVETPVEEQISLREETVSIERRPVTDGRPVLAGDFTDKVIEMTETDEEAVVSKTARVKEEIVIRKGVTDRTETVRDTVRRDEVEVTTEPGVGATSGYQPKI